MVIIERPRIEEPGGASCRLNCDILVDGERRTIWFEVAKEYEPYLCTERCDAYVIGILNWCMREGHDISSEVPMTDELHYNITEFLIPSLTRHSKKLREIRITAPLEPPLEAGFAVGTGCSCGVDSFYSIQTHLDSEYPRMNLTHLCINSVGSFAKCYADYGIERTRQERFEKAAEVAERLNLKLVATNSNFAEAIPQYHLYTHAYSTSFAIYILQKLWRVYYFASSGMDFSYFSLQDSEGKDSSYYDLLSCQCFSTKNLRIYSDGGAQTRLEKTERIADNPLAQQYLHVCLKRGYNCNQCKKCKRTMIMLDACGKLDSFRKVFDVDSYRKNIADYDLWLIKTKWKGGEEWSMMELPYERIMATAEGAARLRKARLRLLALTPLLAAKKLYRKLKHR